MENTRVFVNKTGVLKNTRVFFVKYPGIFQYPGNMTLHRGLGGLSPSIVWVEGPEYPSAPPKKILYPYKKLD